MPLSRKTFPPDDDPHVEGQFQREAQERAAQAQPKPQPPADPWAVRYEVTYKGLRSKP